MTLRFHIHYHTQWGQALYISGSLASLGNWVEEKAAPMKSLPDGSWELELEVEEETDRFAYKYLIKSENDGPALWEWGANREIQFLANTYSEIDLKDHWRPAGKEENAWFSSAFTEVLMRRKQHPAPISSPAKDEPLYHFRIYAPRVGQGQQMCLIGDHSKLGKWEEQEALMMDDTNYPLWELSVPFSPDQEIAYKYAIYDKKEKKILTWETGENRKLLVEERPKKKRLTIVTDQTFRYPNPHWKGTGVSIPVFSLRSANSFGVGEFSDLNAMIDWASQVGMKLVQILPVNDTVATHTWTDSYPYAAISVYALHPIYLHLPAMGKLKDQAAQDQFESQGHSLNYLDKVDYEGVMKAKSAFFKLLYDQEKEAFLKSSEFQIFLAENQEWLVPYAAFSHLRDVNGTADFHQWKQFAQYEANEVEAYAAPTQPHYDAVAIHYFIQYHLHVQLKAASDYAASKGIVFKGDIPIGIYRHSVDAWVAPHLFHMNAQAGAPPDAFAVKGQNWRFPTYNWEVMAQNDFAWWRNRLSHMARYFDAYRIDHILGFFRIWQIPGHAVEGLLGQFNPSLPLTTKEINDWDIWFEEERYTKPYIRSHILDHYFGERTETVKAEFLDDLGHGIWQFKKGRDTQRALEAYLDEQIQDYPARESHYNSVREGLYSLASEVILLPAINGEGFDLRIALHHTYSYQELSEYSKGRLNELYNHYFYHRQDQFWREQALVKLPAIQDATDMLVCGEDLGMVPDSVPGVMNELGILSLEIQRMPKDPKREFAHPADAPYLSVVSPSTHDMASLRGWWEEDRAVTQRFYEQMLDKGGEAPWYCEPWIAEAVLEQHLHSPAMWAIFPLQDLLAINGELRIKDPEAERINIPAVSQHYWRYRMHLNLEVLQEAEGFNQKLSTLLHTSGRMEVV